MIYFSDISLAIETIVIPQCRHTNQPSINACRTLRYWNDNTRPTFSLELFTLYFLCRPTSATEVNDRCQKARLCLCKHQHPPNLEIFAEPQLYCGARIFTGTPLTTITTIFSMAIILKITEPICTDAVV